MNEKYQNVDLNDWNVWFRKYVIPVFDENKREGYYNYLKEKQPPFYPKYWVAEKFYKKIGDDTRFDNELKLFFSFLYSCGFYMEYVISFEEWINMKNWERPWENNTNEETILTILMSPNGDKYLKSRLRWLPFLDRQEGN